MRLTPSLFIILALAACDRTKAPAPAMPAAAAPPNVVTVHAADYVFNAPDQITGGRVTFTLVNDGPSLHHMQIVRLDSAKTLADFQAAMKANKGWPAWAVFAGGPNAADPGGTSSATLDLAAGNYVLLCFVDIPDHVPHMMKGMMHAMVVTAPASATAEAMKPADLTITLSDYKFTLSDSIKAGPQVIDVTVAPGQPHELAIFRLKPGITVADLTKWAANYKGPMPAQAMGGVAANMPGGSARITVNFTPGEYVIMCFVPDAKDGKAHMEHGMMRTLHIA